MSTVTPLVSVGGTKRFQRASTNPTHSVSSRKVTQGTRSLGRQDVGHVGVEILAGMHRHLNQARRLGHRVRDQTGLDELRTYAQNGENFFKVLGMLVIYWGLGRGLNPEEPQQATNDGHAY